MTTLSSHEVYCPLHTQRTNTATGPDGLSAALLKKLAPAITPNVTLIINRCIEESSLLQIGNKPMFVRLGKAKVLNQRQKTIVRYRSSQYSVDCLKRLSPSKLSPSARLIMLSLRSNLGSERNPAVKRLSSLPLTPGWAQWTKVK